MAAPGRCVVRIVGDGLVHLSFKLPTGEMIAAQRPLQEPLEKALHRLAITLTKRLCCSTGPAARKKKKTKPTGGAAPAFDVRLVPPWQEAALSTHTGSSAGAADADDAAGAAVLTNSAAFVDGAVLTLQQRSPLDVAGEGLPAPKMTAITAFTCVVNPPAVLRLHCPTTAFIGVPIVVTALLEFADVAQCRWTMLLGTEILQSGIGEFIAFTPTCAEHVGQAFRVQCQPGKYGVAGLGEVVEATLCAVEIAPPRPWIRRTDPAASEGWSGLVSWNVLADAYSRDVFPYVQPEHLVKGYRAQLVVQEIQAYDPAVCCLQEVDTTTYERLYRPAMEHQGYTGCFAPKGGPTGVEGCAVFTKDAAFRVVSTQTLVLNKACDDPRFADLFQPCMDNVHTATIFRSVTTICQLVQLEGIDSAAPLVVLNTHLFFHPSVTSLLDGVDSKLTPTESTHPTHPHAARAPHVRLIHVAAILQWATEVMRTLPPTTGLIFAGDLNSTPETGVIEFLMTGRVSPHHPEWARGAQMRWDAGPEAALDGVPEEEVTDSGQRRGNLPVAWRSDRGHHHPPTVPPGPDLCHPFAFTSPVSLDTMVANSTNFTAAFCGWLDYIFCAGAVEVVPAQDVIAEEVLRQDVAIPSRVFPSDHVPVVARFRMHAK